MQKRKDLLINEILCKQNRTTGLLDIMQIRKDPWLLDIMQIRKDHWFNRYHVDKKGPLVYEIACRQERTTGLRDIMQTRTTGL